jgi:hypothetical protein
MMMTGNEILNETNDITLHDAALMVMRYQRLYDGKVKGNCECK